ncbi:peptide/nickel transport system substrate-binding protein [Devosia subaequoris]|uniref:Peptide/nickel transport system substrate-binding protein n=1 Tax=Devosia subaequoris TaxID=395930 RepID=A0A7W6IQ72_9HYPH|nr:ABC transporter substrate-binding protein [Devosia subaequoris]MBB4053166.1 peptide/nickel transport system substrate-binding protein [Devosia subaequoris]MCP1210702.1 ABC transporter substrate-binding protein [Devosia subaequoris]
MTARKTLALTVAGLMLMAGPALAQPTEIRIGVALEPPALDPTAGAAEAIDVVVYQNVFEGLVRIDQTGAVQPGLAESWTISEDGQTYRFALNEGVTFHDGTAFDAEDVKFTFDRLLAEDSVNAQKALYEPISAVSVVDPMTVEFTLSRPDGMFLFNLGRGDAVIVAPESAENNGAEPIGTGPFAFIQWDRGSRVVLEQYGPYWGESPALTRASFVFISDTATLTNALLAGDVDGTNNFAAEALAVFENNPQFKVLVGSTEGETILSTNNRKEPFTDLKVRQAMAHALDRQEIIEGATYGYGVPIGTHFAPHHPYYLDLTDTYPHDQDKAKALLAEAGYADGFSATLKLPPVAYARLSGQIIASQFAEVGIELELINMEWAQWLEDVFGNKDFDLTIISHVEPFDVGIYANPDYYFGYDNPEVQALNETLNATTDEAERLALAQEIQTIIARDAVNGYLFELAQTGVWNAKLEGMWQNAPVEGVVLRDIHWAE